MSSTEQTADRPEGAAIQLIQHRAQTWPERAAQQAVESQEGYALAGELLRGIKGLRAEIDATFSPIVSKAFAAHQEALAQRKRVEAPLTDAEGILKRKCAAYVEAEERARRIKEAELAAEARRLEEDLRVEEAVALEEAGEPEAAAAVLDAPPIAPAIVLPAPRAEGISTRIIYRAKVTNLRSLLAAIIAGKVPVQAVMENQSFLDQQARALKRGLDYPGVQLTSERVVAARR